MQSRNDQWCIFLRDNGSGINIVDVNAGFCQDVTVYGTDSGDGLYSTFIEGPQIHGSDPSSYKVTVNWDRIGTNSSEQGELVMWYRPGDL